MDGLRTVESKSSPVVLHRIRRHSHTVTGVPILGIIADGIGSPTDTAHPPPGVVTKIDSIQTKKTSPPAPPSSLGPPKKMMCKNCNKKCNCLCKKCSLEKVKPYSRRENIALRYDENERLQAEVVGFVEATETIKKQITAKEHKLIALRVAVENAKLRIGLKQKEINQLDATKPTVASQFATVFASQKKHVIRSAEAKKQKMAKLAEIEAEVAKKRFQYCMIACRIFPVKIKDGVPQESETTVSQKNMNSKTWTVVNDSELEKGLRTYIRGSYINEKYHAKLANQLSNGTISLPKDLHPCFAAFTNTLQLVHLLSVIFNFRPPESLSHHDLCIRDRWTKESLDRDWSKLRKAVVYLCVFIGMSPSELKYMDPHENLIALHSFVRNNPDKIRRIGSRPTCDLSEVHALIAAQRPEEFQKKDDVDESWIFVD